MKIFVVQFSEIIGGKQIFRIKVWEGSRRWRSRSRGRTERDRERLGEEGGQKRGEGAREGRREEGGRRRRIEREEGRGRQREGELTTLRLEIHQGLNRGHQRLV
jgi:hypothetical protein